MQRNGDQAAMSRDLLVGRWERVPNSGPQTPVPGTPPIFYPDILEFRESGNYTGVMAQMDDMEVSPIWDEGTYDLIGDGEHRLALSTASDLIDYYALKHLDSDLLCIGIEDDQELHYQRIT